MNRPSSAFWSLLVAFVLMMVIPGLVGLAIGYAIGLSVEAMRHAK